MKNSTVKYFLLVLVFFITTGVVMPWVISNDSLPLWMIVAFVSGSIFYGASILKYSVIKFIKWCAAQSKAM